MLKYKIVIIIAMMIIFAPSLVYAAEFEFDSSDYDSLLEDSKANELFDYLTPQSEEMLHDIGIKTVDYDAILNLDFQSIWEGLISNLTDEFLFPIKMFVSVLALILICGVLTSVKTNDNINSTTTTFNIVTVLCVSTAIVPGIVSLMDSTKEITGQIEKFMQAFIPVFAGIISVSGKPVSAFTYSGILLGTIQFMSYIIGYAIFPLVGIYFAFSIISNATGIGNLNSIAKTVQTVILWTLGLILTVFVGMLTIRSFVASSADSVTLRAGKYVVGSFVPIVGGAISESIGVLQGSLSLIKSAVGAFGIVAIIIMVLPAMISLLATMLALKLAKIISDIFSSKLISDFLTASGFVLNLLMSIILCYTLMLIISTSLILSLGAGS